MHDIWKCITMIRKLSGFYWNALVSVYQLLWMMMMIKDLISVVDESRLSTLSLLMLLNEFSSTDLEQFVPSYYVVNFFIFFNQLLYRECKVNLRCMLINFYQHYKGATTSTVYVTWIFYHTFIYNATG